ncbi:MAG TPA: hypothetical protein VFO01_13555 [Trebonia sp.]|nr:hypothetical protein [Trebonia sp.]
MHGLRRMVRSADSSRPNAASRGKGAQWLAPDINALLLVDRAYLARDPHPEKGRMQANMVGARGCPCNCSFCGAAVSANPDITIRVRAPDTQLLNYTAVDLASDATDEALFERDEFNFSVNLPLADAPGGHIRASLVAVHRSSGHALIPRPHDRAAGHPRQPRRHRKNDHRRHGRGRTGPPGPGGPRHRRAVPRPGRHAGPQPGQRGHRHALACLVAADRYHHLAAEIRPRLAAGHVLCDRYLASTLVLQGRDGLPQSWLLALTSTLTCSASPSSSLRNRASWPRAWTSAVATTGSRTNPPRPVPRTPCSPQPRGSSRGGVCR